MTLVQGDSSIKKVEGARGSPRLMTRFSEDQQEEVVLEGAVVKEELVDDDIPYMEDNYLEPTVCLTEPEEVSGGFGQVDPSTVTTNTPTLALATVPPDTPILGGRVTPHPTDRMIAVHPSQFIRYTSITMPCPSSAAPTSCLFTQLNKHWIIAINLGNLCTNDNMRGANIIEAIKYVTLLFISNKEL